jgi:hypothetical protein
MLLISLRRRDIFVSAGRKPHNVILRNTALFVERERERRWALERLLAPDLTGAALV